MTDHFARQTAQHAHTRIATLTQQISRLEKQLARRRAFADRCYLCGDPVHKGSLYCRAHLWVNEGD